jgi:hypothetical protein
MPNVGKPLDSETPRPTAHKRRDHDKPMIDESKIAGSMHTEEPMGSDLAPQKIDRPRDKRHPRPDGVGGLIPADEDTPNVDEKTTG